MLILTALVCRLCYPFPAIPTPTIAPISARRYAGGRIELEPAMARVGIKAPHQRRIEGIPHESLHAWVFLVGITALMTHDNPSILQLTTGPEPGRARRRVRG